MDETNSFTTQEVQNSHRCTKPVLYDHSTHEHAEKVTLTVVAAERFIYILLNFVGTWYIL